MKIGKFVEQVLGMGMADSPKPVHVASKNHRERLEIVSTPGARLRIGYQPTDGAGRITILACLRAGVPVHLDPQVSGIFLDGQPLDALALRALLRTGNLAPR